MEREPDRHDCVRPSFACDEEDVVIPKHRPLGRLYGYGTLYHQEFLPMIEHVEPKNVMSDAQLNELVIRANFLLAEERETLWALRTCEPLIVPKKTLSSKFILVASVVVWGLSYAWWA